MKFSATTLYWLKTSKSKFSQLVFGVDITTDEGKKFYSVSLDPDCHREMLFSSKPKKDTKNTAVFSHTDYHGDVTLYRITEKVFDFMQAEGILFGEGVLSFKSLKAKGVLDGTFNI